MTGRQTYALLIYRTGEGQPSPSQERRALDGHRALQALASSRGELHAVARLDAPSQARTVSLKRGAHAITDGPYVETKEWLIGFYLIEAISVEEAIERAKLICPIEGHAIEVRPVGWRWEGTG